MQILQSLYTYVYMRDLSLPYVAKYCISHKIAIDKPQPIMLNFLPIMLLSNAQKICLLCSILCP